MSPLTAKAMLSWTMLAVASGLMGAAIASFLGAAVGVAVVLLVMLTA